MVEATQPPDSGPSEQDLAIYWDPQFAQLLETWGIGNAWTEIQVLMTGRQGKMLDLACGTGRIWDFLKHNPGLDYFGIDIAPPLIEKAKARGIDPARLKVGDAMKLPYGADSFDYVVTIGSLEHFTEDGIIQLLSETRRVCRGLCFHQFPISKSGRDEGWISPYQSYWNNSIRWWTDKIERVFGSNYVLMQSRWADRLSSGIWFITYRDGFVV